MSVILNAKSLREAADVADQIEALKQRLAALLGGDNVQVTTTAPVTNEAPKRKMSNAARAKIAAAQRERWAKQHAAEAASAAPVTPATPAPAPVAAEAPVAVAA